MAGCSITGGATSISETGATLNGLLHPRGGPGSWWFEYGRTAFCGSQTAHQDAGTEQQLKAVSVRVTGLTPDTTYHYRLCDLHQGDGAPQCGEDRTFTTGSNRLPAGFSEEVAFSGLTEPTAVRFAADGRVFVAEKSGLIKVFDGLDD